MMNFIDDHRRKQWLTRIMYRRAQDQRTAYQNWYIYVGTNLSNKILILNLFIFLNVSACVLCPGEWSTENSVIEWKYRRARVAVEAVAYVQNLLKRFAW